MFNAFRPTVKKPQSLMSPGQQNASTYAPNLVQSFGQSLFQQKNPISPPVSMQSKAPVSNVSRPIQASGMSSQYASNPTNYKPVSSVQGGQQYPSPLTVPNRPPAPAPTASQNYMSSVNQGAANQTALAEKMRRDAQNFKTQQNTLANQQLNASGQDYQQTFNQFKGDTEAQIAANAVAGETQKSNARDNFGEAQKLAAQTRRETQGQTQRTFANLNTLDSRGEGSFGQATENTDSAFNSFTQGNLKQQAQKLTEIDAQIQSAERTARAAITTEQQKMTGLLRDIEYAKQNNDLQLASQLTDDYNKTQSYIYDIADNVQQMKYSFSLEQEKLNAAQEAISQQTANLSPEFIQTGVAKTMNDFIFRTQHPEMFAKVGAATGGQSAAQLQVSGKSSAGLNAINTIQSEIQNNPDIIAQYKIPGSPGARTYAAAVSSLTDAIGGLRTGASVSPAQQKFYENMLPRVGDDPQTILYKLGAVRQELQGYAGGSQNMAGDSLSQDQISQILASLGN